MEYLSKIVMSKDSIFVEICGIGGKVTSKLHNVAGITLFSDLLAICKNDLKTMDLIVNQDVKTIYIKGKRKGGTERIKALVDENYNLADICFNQNLFEVRPIIQIAYDYHRLPFYFSADDRYDCTLKYFCGSKTYGEAFLDAINISKERFQWSGKLTQKYYEHACSPTGMQNDKIGLNTQNCVVFTVTTPRPISESVLKCLDTYALQHRTADCKLAILFRNADFLKASLQNHISEPLADGVVYLILFKTLSTTSSKPSSADTRIP